MFTIFTEIAYIYNTTYIACMTGSNINTRVCRYDRVVRRSCSPQSQQPGQWARVRARPCASDCTLHCSEEVKTRVRVTEISSTNQ